MKKFEQKMISKFPEDGALQQVHIAHKIISKEAEKKGMKYIDYVKQLIHEIEAD